MLDFNKAIITCAVTGAVHTPTMSPHLPISPDEIADSAIGAAEAGASMVHLHARMPDGRPTADPEVFERFVPKIRAHTNAVINISTGGAPGMTMDQRLAAARALRPELVSLNMGSINFGFHQMASRYKEWKYDWEEQFLLSSREEYSVNSFAVLESIICELSANATSFEFECYDIGHLYNLKYLEDIGVAKSPFMIQFIFGFMGGIGIHTSHLEHFYETAERLFGDRYYMSVLAAGKQQMRFGTMSASRGGGVRVGLEDSLYIAPRQLAKTNAEQVALIREVLEKLHIPVATPEEARAALALRGRTK